MTNNHRRKSLAITLTQRCNLNCTYCYENNRSSEKIDIDLAKNKIKEHISRIKRNEEIEISFHGGEPFLEFDLLKEICDWYWKEKFPIKSIFFVTSNGTLIHGEIQKWLKNNRDKIYVALSIDGTREMHNINRSSSFDLIDLDFFSESWPIQPVKMTISEETINHLSDGIIFLHKKNLLIQANFAYGINWESNKNITALNSNLKKLINYYLQIPSITPCDILSMDISLISSQKEKKDKWCGVGTDMTAIDIDGQEYPCHLFFPMALNKKTSFDWNDTELLLDNNCIKCPIYNICPTCYGINLINNGHPAIRDRNLCVLTKIRAKASSLFEAKKIEYHTINNIDKYNANEIYHKIKAIKIIQDHLQ